MSTVFARCPQVELELEVFDRALDDSSDEITNGIFDYEDDEDDHH